MQAGCSGFIYAQSVAKQFLVNGRCRNVLVIGAELLSKYLDWTDRGDLRHLRRRRRRGR